MTKKAKPATSRRSKAAFYNRFNVEDQYLVRPDSGLSRSGVLRATTRDTNQRVLIKVWPRSVEFDDRELAEIWRHEVRQMYRLAGYPGAMDLIVPLVEADQDKDGFYLVLGAENFLEPLSVWKEQQKTPVWLRLPRSPADRRKMWLNLKRVAHALEILHKQGLLHRNIDLAAVHSTCSEEPDFKLSGFEWSVRMASAQASSVRGADRNLGEVMYSFRSDWMAYALLAADLFGISRERLLRQTLPASDVNESMRAEEIRLLRQLVGMEPIENLDGDVVAERIETIAASIQAELSDAMMQHHLVLATNMGGRLAEAVRALDDLVETDQEVLDWITEDLSEAVHFITLSTGPLPQDVRYALRGKNLVYRLLPYRRAVTAEANWTFAYCHQADRILPNLNLIVSDIAMPPGSIRLLPQTGAVQATARLYGKVAPWDSQIAKTAPPELEETKADKVYRALGLVQLLETLVAAAESYPVKPIRVPSGAPEHSPDGTHELWITPREDSSLELLSSNLDLRPPARRLAERLNGDEVFDEDWVLSELLAGERDQLATEWRFDRVENVPNTGTVYVFKGNEPVPSFGEQFIRPKQFDGQAELIRRRLKTLQALRDHRELMAMMGDLRSRVVNSHDDLNKDGFFEFLDPPKRHALELAWSVLPVFLVQGPPGVGKTRLVREVVRRRQSEDITSRFLLTAQSHHAVAHLLQEIVEEFRTDDRGSEAEGPLIVRVVPRDQKKEVRATEYDLDVQTKKLLERIGRSKLAEKASSKLKARLGILSGNRDEAYRRERLYMEGAVLRSANMVFATTNAQALERLIDERAQVDWTIIEEAGKATGPELVAPLLLSHRRLLIGDHKQLPPFNSDYLIKLLAKHQQVGNAIKLAVDVIGRSIRDDSTADLIESLTDNPSDIPALCAQAISVIQLFEHWIETEYTREEERRKRNKPEAPLKIALQLTEQHRMHPSIARLVSDCFYNGTLDTGCDAKNKFQVEEAAGKCPTLFLTHTKIPSKPIVLVNTRYVSKGGADGEAAGSRYRNFSERDAVLAVLQALRVNPNAEKKPSIAVLSPYRQQVNLIDQSISELRSTKLSHLSEFALEEGGRIHCGTVDSFQGDEADVIVLSLVRNNAHAGVRALGFLSDARRMNVLLSRAKWRLILVGSLDFLKEVINAPAAATNVDLTFMRRFVAGLDGGNGGVGVVRWEELRQRRG